MYHSLPLLAIPAGFGIVLHSPYAFGTTLFCSRVRTCHEHYSSYNGHVTITFFLLRLRVGFKRTDGVVNVLVTLIICSGLLPGIMAIIAVITAETMPHSFAYLLVDFCISKRE